MGVIYILGIFICLILTVYFWLKRASLKQLSQDFKETKKDIEDINHQLDYIHALSEEYDDTFDKINKISSSILKYRQ